MTSTENRVRSRIGFADLYLERYGFGAVTGLPEPDPDLCLIIVIPAYKEPFLVDSVKALLASNPPDIKWEILVNINFPEGSSAQIVAVSMASLKGVEEIGKGLDRSDVRIHCLWSPNVPSRHAGVGLARKVAMDQAVSRFNSIGRSDGIIVSFDADSTCEIGYLKTIVDFYKRRTSARTANIYFEHPLGGPFNERIYHSIAQYELYLRYMRLTVEWTGHPHSIHTVGSSFSLRVKTYIRVNGMGRDKAGEDFYFLHKCMQQKGFWEINETTVYPSVRESDRVTFGTGASVQRQMSGNGVLDVYSFDSFVPLKEFFGRVGYWWQLLENKQNLSEGWNSIAPALDDFLKRKDAITKITVMHKNSASELTFRDKFFAWFNGFMILKYLNETHKNDYCKGPVMQHANQLAEILGIRPAECMEGMLVNFRIFEKSRGNRKII
jgi:hypothetical protein